MVVAIDPNLIERVVFEYTRNPPPLAREYHRQLSACYDESQGDRRQRAFRSLHERWFDRLGLRRRLTHIVDEFPRVPSRVDRLIVAPANGRGQPSADLFGKPGRYTVVLTIAAAIFLDTPSFEYGIRHEFQHIDDMLDPAFGFDPSLRPAGRTTAARNLIRDRYTLLWAVSIDARLSDRVQIPPTLRDQRRSEFTRAFASVDAASSRAAFDRLWNDWRGLRPTHAALLDWARHGPPGTSRDGISGGHAPAAGPAAPCALCQFSTFDWADLHDAAPSLLSAVKADFPRWTPADGMCGQCAELYRSRITTLAG